MTRKHFVALAAALQATNASPETVSAVCDVLATTNPAFDRARFYAAAIQE